MGKTLGMNAKLYYDETPIVADASGASWTEIDAAKEVTTSLEAGEADVTTRANTGWRSTMAALRDGTLEFEVLWDHEDANIQAFTDAFIGGTVIAVAAMDGDIADAATEGFAANFTVTGMTRPEPLEEGITMTFTLKPYSKQQWYRVGS